MKSNNYYIIFEGIDGTGKSTLAKKVYNYFKNPKYNLKNFDVIFIREPGGTPFNEKLRKIIAREKLMPVTQLFLFLAGRAELYNILSKLKNTIIIMDRSFLSTFAYQSVLLNLPFKKIYYLHSLINIPVSKAIVFVLLAEPDIVRRRLDKKHIFHTSLNDKTLKRINDKYKMLENTFAKYKFIYLDANKSKKELFDNVIEELKRFKLGICN